MLCSSVTRQWGLVGTDTQGTGTISFPIAFAEKTFAVNCIENNAAAWSLSDGFAIPGVTIATATTTSISIRSIWIKPRNIVMFGGESIGYIAIGK